MRMRKLARSGPSCCDVYIKCDAERREVRGTHSDNLILNNKNKIKVVACCFST